MAAGYQLTEGQMKAIRETVRHYFNLFRGEGEGRRRTQDQASYYAKLDGDLAAATAGNYNSSSAPTATASVWTRTSSDGIEDSGRNVTVRNRFGIAYTTGTMGIVEWLCGEWVFTGDCDPL